MVRRNLPFVCRCSNNSSNSTAVFHRSCFTACCSAFDQLGAVEAQMPIVEQAFTPDVCVGTADSQPAIIQSIQYVRGQVEASIIEFTTWKTQMLSLGYEHTGQSTEQSH